MLRIGTGITMVGTPPSGEPVVSIMAGSPGTCRDTVLRMPVPWTLAVAPSSRVGAPWSRKGEPDCTKPGRPLLLLPAAAVVVAVEVVVVVVPAMMMYPSVGADVMGAAGEPSTNPGRPEP